MAGVNEELKIRIVPELDKGALKSVQDELNAIKPNVAVPSTNKGGGGGGAGGSGGGGSAVADMKAQQVEMKKVFDGIQQRLIQEDILLRTTRMRIQREIELTRQQGAQGKITNEQMIQSVNALEAESVDAANNTRIAYDALNQEIGHTASQFQDVDGVLKQTNRVQSKLLVNTGHLDSGFVTMATSLDKITSQTKNTNLAFMNFGRIIQDAPFGLIGIANNIDPMLNSFSQLSKEIDVSTGKVRGFGGALGALAGQLLKPAGLIFLLGSALPSALLVFQSMQRKTAKEANELADSFKKVADEFAKLSGQAASERGLPQITKELGVVNTELDIANEELAKMESGFAKIAEEQSRATASGAANIQAVIVQQEQTIRQLREQNKERLTSLDKIIKAIKAQKESLDINKQEIEDIKFIREEAEKRNKSQSLFDKERLEKLREIYEIELNALQLLDPIQAEIRREQDKIRGEIAKIFADASIFGSEQGKRAINILRRELELVADKVRAKYAETGKAIQADDNRLFKTREELESSYTKYVQNETINRLNAEQATMLELMESEFTTDEERLRIYKKFQENRTKILEDELNRQRAIQARADKEALDAINKQRMAFVKFQMDMVSASEARIMGRQDLLLSYYENTGMEILAIELRREMQLADLRRQYQAKELLDTQEYAAAVMAINQKTDQEVLQTKIDQGKLIADAAIQVYSAIFGEGKATATAQVIVDTLAGAQKAIATYKLPFGPIVAAGIVAKGAIAIRKINSTDRKSSSLSAGTSTPFVREVAFQGVGPNTGQLISTNADQSAASASPNQMSSREAVTIQANVDRRGLAIAVREGEQEIRTEQFAYV